MRARELRHALIGSVHERAQHTAAYLHECLIYQFAPLSFSGEGKQTHALFPGIRIHDNGREKNKVVSSYKRLTLRGDKK